MIAIQSIGIYGKSLHCHLGQSSLQTWVVNAHVVEHVPGRKTDIGDSQCLAVLTRFGLVRGRFIPPENVRQ